MSKIKKIKSLFSKKEKVKYLNETITNILNKVKQDMSDENPPPMDLINKLRREIGTKLIFDLALDTFVRGLESNYKLRKKKKAKCIQFIDDYLSTLKRRLKLIYEVDDEDVVIDPYKKWTEIAEKRPKSKIDLVSFEKENGLLQAEIMKFPTPEDRIGDLDFEDLDKNEMLSWIEELKRPGMIKWLRDNNKKLLILCEGRDTAGKGGFIKTMTMYMNPMEHYKVNIFPKPTEYDREHWFERYEKSLPTTQPIAFYDRSWYNRAVIEPANGYCTKEEYDNFMNQVLEFEYKLIDDGYILIKLWFSITKETQKLRFDLRKTSPIKYWKFKPNDELSYANWEKITYFKDEMFKKTSTEKSPWIIVDSNDKRLSRLNAMRWILNQVPYPKSHYKDKLEILQVYPEMVYPLIYE